MNGRLIKKCVDFRRKNIHIISYMKDFEVKSAMGVALLIGKMKNKAGSLGLPALD